MQSDAKKEYLACIYNSCVTDNASMHAPSEYIYMWFNLEWPQLTPTSNLVPVSSGSHDTFTGNIYTIVFMTQYIGKI